MLSETLQKNKAARETAESVMALAEENLTDQINHQRFWETLAKLAMSRGGLASRPNMSEALNEFESKHFETLSMPFGKYKDQPVGKVPCDYLSWCTENDFGDQLRRYVLSDRFKIRNVEEHKEEFTDG